MLPGRDCEGCNRKYQFFPSNTIVVWYEFQPWISFAQSVCPACACLGRTFFRDNYEECMEYFITNEFSFTSEQYADGVILSQFEATYDLSQPKEVQLTPRLEDEVERLQMILSVIPDDLLLDMMETPQPHNLPEMWHDA